MTPCGNKFACPIIEDDDCTKICCFVKRANSDAMSASLIVEPAAVKFSAEVSALIRVFSSLFCVEPSRPLILFKLSIVTCNSYLL